MTNISNKWLEEAIADKRINCLNRGEFSSFVKIGEGGNSFVYRSEWKNYRLTVALKILKVNMDSGGDIKGLVKELQVLQKVGFHPNITRFYGVMKEDSLDGSYKLVLEFADNGDLREYLKINYQNLQWTDKILMAKEITQGLVFLHANNIIHRDLHSKNVLVHEGKMMITDFGLSRNMNDTSIASYAINIGMPAYIEPQFFKDTSYVYDEKSDIYSLGVIFWEISSGRPPFQKFTTNEAVAVYIFQGKRENPVEGTPSQYTELYSLCWDENPKNRPEAKEILKNLNLLSSSNFNSSTNNRISSDEDVTG